MIRQNSFGTGLKKGEFIFRPEHWRRLSYPLYKRCSRHQGIDKNINKLIYEKFPRKTRIFIEPGRAVVGDAGIFVSQVIGKAKRGDENWLSIDVGVFNGLMESIGGIKYSYIVEGVKG